MSFKSFLVLALSAKWPMRNHFSNFERGSATKHVCEIILKSGHFPTRRCHLDFFLIFSSGSHIVQLSGTI